MMLVLLDLGPFALEPGIDFFGAQHDVADLQPSPGGEQDMKHDFLQGWALPKSPFRQDLLFRDLGPQLEGPVRNREIGLCRVDLCGHPEHASP